MRPERLFRWLLRLLPFDFRSDYGHEMELVFRDLHREAQGRGPRALGRLWRRSVSDVLRTAPRVHAQQIRQDAGYALRNLRRAPAFTASVLLVLALGIGANTAVFSMVWSVVLKPLPWIRPAELAAVWNSWDGAPQARLSDPELLDYSERTRSLRIGGEARGAVSVAGPGEPERVAAAYVTANLLELLGVPPALGRGFRQDEEHEGRPRVVALSHAFWQRRFASDASVIGRSVRLDGEPFEIVAVLPAGFLLPGDMRSEQPAQVLLPLLLDRAAPRDRRGGHYLLAVARLERGVSLAEAQAELATVASGLMRQYPDEHDQGGFAVRLAPLRDDLLGPSRPVLLVLAASVGLVLLLTCANVAGLLLARAEARRRELAVRSALGADRLRLVRQLLTEAAVLAFGGALAGLGVAAVATRAAVRLAPAALPRLDQVSLDTPVLGFTLVLATLAALVFGALPAVQVSQVGSAEILGEATRGSTAGRSHVRRALVSVQVSIAAVLLVGAGLLLKSYARLQSVPSGFDPESVLTLRLSLPESGYPARHEVTAFYHRLLESVRSLPGVRTAGAASGLPLAVGSGDWSFDVEGRPRTGSRHHGAADWFAVTPGYFESLKVPLIGGRLPSEDDGEEGTQVVFLNATAARLFFAGENPVGQRVQLTRTTGPDQPWRVVAGIVGDVRHRGLDQPPRPEMFVPHAQFLHFMAGAQARTMSLVLRTDVTPLSVAAALRGALSRLDPGIPVASLGTMDDVVSASIADRRRDLGLIGAFALLAVVLAAVGLYGLIATTVAQRVREIGVRIALGASASRVARMVVGDAVAPVRSGVVIGLAVALLSTRRLESMLFEVGPRDVVVLAVVTTLLFAVGGLASLAPAWRAARLDAAIALRQD
ncbi:MAG TPA: ABC transporter permease [Vicinamibacteria bacterium]|nr:ABC transporter permease [Vicinamibacteria bacterium]